jgi:three-Cys-motif partner protein
MKDKPFKFAYIDAFAGTGYVEARQKNSDQLLLQQQEDVDPDSLAAFAEAESQGFLDGSARIALQIDPRFSKYIFIEKKADRFRELQLLKDEFPSLSRYIVLENADANTYLMDLCKKDWSKRRAVLFLDPFGMAVEWATVEAVAQTKAIDLWYLFPLGVAVNRLLRRDGQIPVALSRRLDLVFGSHDWYDLFYKVKSEQGLFGEHTNTGKVAGFDQITDYFVGRLRDVFSGVAENPLPLYSSCNNPLFLLCFASGNPKGAPTAVKIAQHILSR